MEWADILYSIEAINKHFGSSGVGFFQGTGAEMFHLNGVEIVQIFITWAHLKANTS